MNNFFRIFFASLLAIVVFAVLTLFVGVIFVSAVASGKEAVTGEKAVLVVDLADQYPEVPETNPFSVFGGAPSKPSLYDLVRLIRHAKTNNSVKGIFLKCGRNSNQIATLQEIRNALNDFNTSDKFVYAYGAVIPQAGYYVASVADKVYCAPTGGLDWHGLTLTMPFIKGALEKLEIQPQIFYAGKFKSATEPFRETEMTEANRLQSTALLNDIYQKFLTDISTSRKLDTASLRRYADSNEVQFAGAALSRKMVDGLKYDDEVKDEMRSLLKIDADEKINFVSTSKYAQAEDIVQSGSGKIAVIYAEGMIFDGTGDRGAIGGDTYRDYVRRARMDKTVKAIVLRVNSEGGSAAASEQIWREVDLAKKVKPVIVSFGDIAASGGYYISCAADSIFAQNNTITGSIGVFGVIPNMQKFFNNKLGITFDDVHTSPDAGMQTVVKPLTETQKRYIQSGVDSVYIQFKQRVAKGRNRPLDEIENIAQGRVWSGSTAVQLGLVDRIGGIQDAVAAAAAKAKLKDYRLKEYPGKQSFFEMFFNSEPQKESMIKQELGEEGYKTYSAVRAMKKLVGSVQARMPFGITIE
ncbi:MAG: signal peptide peptidase SppA [Chitinophagaceae bacterium]|nr:signal peptide peptidase SppA [Chitinophagaceae bacterium]